MTGSNDKALEPSFQFIHPASSLRGEVEVPGDKSISHRALMLAAIASGESRIFGLSSAADVRSTAACLRALGVEIVDDRGAIRVQGRGLHGLRAPGTLLDAGNSGTTMRLLAGILAGQPFVSEIDGDASLRRRPMRRIIEPLMAMGARISATPQGTAPLRIRGGELQSLDYTLPVASAQVKSCLLLAGLYAGGCTTVREPAATRDHTEIMLRYMGVPIERRNGAITVQPVQPRPAEIRIPGDFSSAAFLLAAALLVPGSEVCIRNVGINPTRSRLLEILRSMGADIAVDNRRNWNGEPVGDLIARSRSLQAVVIQPVDVPLIIDEIPILAVLAALADGRTTIRGAAELRVKESDRLHAVATNLRAMGVEVHELPDGLEIQGLGSRSRRLQPARLQSFGDHRIAMAFAVAGLVAEGPVYIEDAEVCGVSFPEFFQVLQTLAQR